MAESKIDLIILSLTAEFIAESDTIIRDANLSNLMRDRISRAMVCVFGMTTLAYGQLAEVGVYPGIKHMSEYVGHAMCSVNATAVRFAYAPTVELVKDVMIALLDREMTRVCATAWRNAFADED